MFGQKEKDPKFYSELKQLNEDLLEYLKKSHEQSPYFDFSPTFKDYIKQFEDLEKKYSSDKTIQQPAPFFSFFMPPQPPIRKEEEEINSNNKDTNNADTTAGEEETLPPEPKIDKYEEPDSKHSVKCKLYEKIKGTGSEIQVNLLGIGVLYVKALETPSKLQVIVRQEPDLRRVILNGVITNSIPVKLLPKAVQMIFPDSTGETKFYIVKVKDESDANTLYEMLNLAKS